MKSRFRLWWAALVIILAWAGSAHAQQPSAPAPGRNLPQMKFTTLPRLSTCTTGTVLSGDPAKSSSIMLIKSLPGCTVPWHWHSPSEHLMVVSGSAEVAMKDGKPFTLRAGGYAMMPAHHIHRFRSITASTIYLYSEAPFDLHYVNAEGKEIAPVEALKPDKETPATEMK